MYLIQRGKLHIDIHAKYRRQHQNCIKYSVILLNIIIGTYINPPRRPPADIGIENPMPENFLGQLKIPFTRAPL